MLRRLLLLAAIVGLKAWLWDRWLAARRGDSAPRPLRMLVVVEAPIGEAWPSSRTSRSSQSGCTR